MPLIELAMINQASRNMGGWLLFFGGMILVVPTTRDIGESQKQSDGWICLAKGIFRWYYLHCEVDRRLQSMCYVLRISNQGKSLQKHFQNVHAWGQHNDSLCQDENIIREGQHTKPWTSSLTCGCKFCHRHEFRTMNFTFFDEILGVWKVRQLMLRFLAICIKYYKYYSLNLQGSF